MASCSPPGSTRPAGNISAGPSRGVTLRTPPGPEGSKGKRALAGARGVLHRLRGCTGRATTVVAAGETGGRAATTRAPTRVRRSTPAVARALYNTYRPRDFSQVIGQEHVTDALQTALRTGRLHHAFLFSGPRGCGKTSSARILAASLNCVNGPTPTPCGECGPVRGDPVRVVHGRHRDRRCLARWGGRRQGHARAGRLRTGDRALQDLRRRRGARGHAGRLQRPAEAGRRAPAVPEVRLRDDGAGQGHPDHPVPDPSLRVPAGAADRAAAPPGNGLRVRGRRRRPAGAAAGGPGGRRIGARRPLGAGSAPRRRRRGRPDLRQGGRAAGRDAGGPARRHHGRRGEPGRRDAVPRRRHRSRTPATTRGAS